MPHLYNGLSTILHEDGATLVVTVASVSEKCERWWMLEVRTKALSEAARLALGDQSLSKRTVETFEDYVKLHGNGQIEY